MHTGPSSRKQHRNTGADKSRREKVLIAREFLESLAKLPSHYCREDSQKLYLETVITSRTHLNKAFQEYCDSKGKLRVSRQVLLKEMKMQNIATHYIQTKKDQCNVCLGHKYGTVSEQDFREHEKRKEESRQEKKNDKREAEGNDSIMVLTVDLQEVLLAPRVFANANYYKTKLCCHDFTIYNVSNRDVMCYFWHEVNGELKSSNFASCILDHLESVVDDSVSTVILYSDGCCYQNRNVTLPSALIHFAVSRRKTIFQKFLEKGHTWMEVESVHSAIEGKLRGCQIFWPAEYIDVITAARRDHPYEVKQVDHTFFRDFSKLNF